MAIMAYFAERIFFLGAVVCITASANLMLQYNWPEPDRSINRFPHESSCHYYYLMLSEEDITIEKCPDGQLFDYVKHSCISDQEQIHCWNRRYGKLIHEHMRVKHKKHFRCPYPWGKYPNLHDCKKYHLCLNGKSKVKKCAPYELFDKISRKCIAAIDAVCADKTDVVEHGYKCPKTWGSFTYSKDCSKYYECLQRKPSLRTCQKGHLFDDRVMKCAPNELVHCGLRHNPYEKVMSEVSETSSDISTTYIQISTSPSFDSSFFKEVTVTPSSILKEVKATPEKASSNIKESPSTQQEAFSNIKEVPSTPLEAFSNIKEVPSTPKEAFPNIKDVPSTPQEAFPNIKEVPSTPQEAFSNIKEVPSTPQESFHNIKDVPSTPQEAFRNIKEVPSTPQEAFPIIKEVPSTPQEAFPIIKEVPSTPPEAFSDINEVSSTPPEAFSNSKEVTSPHISINQQTAAETPGNNKYFFATAGCVPEDSMCIIERDGTVVKCSNSKDLQPHPNDEKKFLDCTEDKIHVYTCPSGLTFHPNTKKCRWQFIIG